MNPLALLVLGGVALMALTSKKKPTGTGNGNGNGPALPDAQQDDHVMEEGVVMSAGGIEYKSQIWRLYDNQFDYLGELMVESEWVPGPIGLDLPLVRAGLQEMADSFDSTIGFDPQVADPCEGAIDGVFNEQAFAGGNWGPTGMGITPDLSPQPYTWCVVQVWTDAGPGTFGYEGRLVHLDTREVIFRSAPQAIADIAASMAAYAASNPFGPFPWVEYNPGFGLQG